ncbi:hypothetical protein ACFVIM_21305 [Streptomyces sp. NPDC057638]|uniref:hypothetical protein n=1 Tax=Streptomyces sp. NPDC057638 TaxID=3346190 RepID=UPI00367A6ED6
MAGRSAVAVTSLAADLGYGHFRFTITTDPRAASGTPYSLTMNAGANVVRGTIAAVGSASYDAVRRISAGPKVATCTVDGDYDPGRGDWEMEALTLTRFSLSGQRLTVDARWCVSGGGPTSGDVEFVWGDGNRESATMTAPDWTQGRVTRRNDYVLLPDTRTYEVTVTSGAQAVTRSITVPGTGRVVLTTASGETAVVDVQAWPERAYARSSATLAVVGREDPIVLLDALRSPTGTVTFLTRTDAEAAALLTVLRSPAPIRLASPCPAVPNVSFVALSTAAARLTADGSDPRRLWPTPIQEVP